MPPEPCWGHLWHPHPWLVNAQCVAWCEWPLWPAARQPWCKVPLWRAPALVKEESEQYQVQSTVLGGAGSAIRCLARGAEDTFSYWRKDFRRPTSSSWRTEQTCTSLILESRQLLLSTSVQGVFVKVVLRYDPRTWNWWRVFCLTPWPWGRGRRRATSCALRRGLQVWLWQRGWGQTYLWSRCCWSCASGCLFKIFLFCQQRHKHLLLDVFRLTGGKSVLKTKLLVVFARKTFNKWVSP